MKTVNFEPIGESIQVHTNNTMLKALLAKELDVLVACGGKGLCATCHVFVDAGSEQLSPRTAREERTLGCVSGSSTDSRLACQARILGEGVVVRLPKGMYVERAEDLMALMGKRAEHDILHPIDGSVLIAQGKLITKSRLEKLKHLQEQVAAVKGQEG